MKAKLVCINKAGIYLLKGFYSNDQIRNIFNEYKQKIELNDYFLFSNYGAVYPALFRRKFIDMNLVNHKKIEKIVSTYFKMKIKVTKHSDYHINTYGDWHTDTGTKKNYLPESFYEYQKNSNIFKAAIFNKFSINSPTAFKINNNIYRPKVCLGDILIFRVELLHRAPKINFFKKILFKLCPIFLIRILIKKSKREAIFFTLGKKGSVLDYFLDQNQIRENIQLKNLKRI